MIGHTISHYKILDKLGEGGMGIVYRAEDTRLGRNVALKFLSTRAFAGEGTLDRFRREARNAASMSHPNICTIYEIDEYEGQPFIAMELVEGRSLSSIIAEGPMELAKATDIAIQIAEGLNEAQERGIVHRDVKPANIMITDAGRAKITDFGLALVTDQTRLTCEASAMGTVAYMSPEQTRGGDVDHRTDIWAFGAVLYEMITGLQPFRGEYDQAVIYSITNLDPEPPTALRTGVPMELERIVMKALARRAVERYQHVDELLVDLRRLERAAPSKTALPKRRSRKGGLVAAACVIAAVAGYIVLKPLVLERNLEAAPKPVAVISFENMTGDPSYDYLCKAIPNLLITSLEQSRYLRVTTWERMNDLLKQLNRKDVDVIDKELGFELCSLDGIDVIVTGSFIKAGNTFATDIKVLDVGTKEILKSASARGEGVESILKRQVDDLSREIARGVGLSRRRLEQTQRPVIDVTTGSMEAYNYYLRGVEEFDKHYNTDACRFLEKAVAIDSTFAMAYMYLGWVYGKMSDRMVSDEAYEKAIRFAAHATERERLYIESRYALIIENDVGKHVRLLEELVRLYPKEKRGYEWLAIQAGNKNRLEDAISLCEKALALDPGYASCLNQIAYLYARKGDNPKALDYFERYAAASPGDANPLDSMAELYFRMGDIGRAIEKYREAIEVKPDFYGSMKNVAYMYGVVGEIDSALVWMDRYLRVVPSAGMRIIGLGWRSLAYFLIGRVRDAFADIETWEEFGRVNPRFPTSAQAFFKGNYLLETGRYSEAEQAIDEWQVLMDRMNPEYHSRTEGCSRCIRGLIYIRAGRLDDAGEQESRIREISIRIMEEAPSTYGRFQDNFANFRGELLLARGLYDEAAELLLNKPPPGMMQMGDEEVISLNMPMNHDVLARVFIAMGDLERAAVEYERIVSFDPAGNDRRLRNPRFRYRLAKVYEKLGRREDAIDQYERFLDIWKNADRDLPEYKDSRLRLSALRE